MAYRMRGRFTWLHLSSHLICSFVLGEFERVEASGWRRGHPNLETHEMAYVVSFCTEILPPRLVATSTNSSARVYERGVVC